MMKNDHNDSKDILFAPYGHLRRIKIYRDAHGKPKGDALITYAKPGSTTAAINKVRVPLPSLPPSLFFFSVLS